jgi:hypothetical protein
VNIGARAARKAFEEIAHQFGLQISHPGRPNLGIDDRNRASPEIYGRQAESFIHGHDKVASPQNPTAISQGPVKNLAQRNPNVFHGMVLIHVEVTSCRDFQVESAVAREELQHVVKKTDPG